MSEENLGSSIDDFLKEEGAREDARLQAAREVVAWELAEVMKARKICKARWPRCSRRAARKWTGCSTRGMTSRWIACNERQL